ncbi:hypothetical protein [Ruegeria sp. HKCCD7318]|uniref:hypothetical protein n=1 Tax=Ruegeria sp. HKCCD7318 TaxID=2683014 RepID=UPI00147ABB80|nr:hypothetical protein [Ruegeria sp. HKCCD7318]NOE35241.1 hypothetical protein [Ruegeria sp. HKCCD7318]
MKVPFHERVKAEQRKLDRKGVDLIGMLEASARNPNDRKGAIHALYAVIGSLDDAGAQPHLTVKLRRLRSALEDLDNGRVAPMLRKAEIENRPHASDAETRIKTFAAIMVDTGKAQGLFGTLGDGYTAVARIASNAGLDVRPDTIRGWHASVRRWAKEVLTDEGPLGLNVEAESGSTYQGEKDDGFKTPFDDLQASLIRMIKSTDGS